MIAVFGLSFVFFKILAALKLLRVSAEVEIQGLDLAEVGALAYPDIYNPTPLPAAVAKPEKETPSVGLGGFTPEVALEG